MPYELFCVTYNIEVNRGYGVKNLHRFLNLAVIPSYLGIYLEDRHTGIGYQWVFVKCKRNGSFSAWYPKKVQEIPMSQPYFCPENPPAFSQQWFNHPILSVALFRDQVRLRNRESSGKINEFMLCYILLRKSVLTFTFTLSLLML